MFKTLIFTLPLIGGYAFSTIWVGSLYHSVRETGHRLYFRAVFYAFFLALCAFVIHFQFYCTIEVPQHNYYAKYLEFISKFLNSDNYVLSFWSNESKISIAVFSFLLGPLLGHALNKIRWLKKITLESAIQSNDFEKLIYKSARENIPILITLQSRKVYLGWAVSLPNPNAMRKAVRILPLASGYRTEDTQSVKLPTSYINVLQQVENKDDGLDHLNLEDFEVVIPVEQIVASHLFDVVAYEKFYADDDFIKLDLIGDKLRVDLRSTTPAELMLSSDSPYLYLWLRVNNLTNQNIIIDRMLFDISLNQIAIHSDYLDKIEMSANSEKDNILLKYYLNEIQLNSIKNWVKNRNCNEININIMTHIDHANGQSCKSFTISLPKHQVKITD